MRHSILRGALKFIVLPDVLSFVGMLKKTGELVFRRVDVSKKIFLEDGEIIFAASSDPEDSLGAFFVRNGVITQADNLTSQAMVTPEQRQGKILVQMGLIAPKELWWGVKNQILEIIYSLFSWAEGEFEFFETDEVREERIALNVSTVNIILEGVRRLDEWSQIKTRIPSPDVVLERHKAKEDIELNEDEKEILKLVNGRRTVHDIIAVSQYGEFKTTKLLFSLLAAELVRVKERMRKPAKKEDIDDTYAIKKVIEVYNSVFRHIFREVSRKMNGESEQAQIVFNKFFDTATNYPESIFREIKFDENGGIDERTLIANIADIPPLERARALDNALNDLLSFELFEITARLNQEEKIALYRWVAQEKGKLPKYETSGS